MNTLKLSLENFQAISNGILEFKTGLNFIIGQSNSGKTATFRALKDCLLNPNKAARHIRNGFNQATVTLKYNGNKVEWKRTPKSSTYVINGEEYIKVGRSDVFKLLDNSGFVQGISGTIMNIEEELQLPFPFGMSKQELFKLYEDVFCISDSAIILKAAKGQEDQLKFEIANLENDNLKNNKKIEELEKFKKEINMELLLSYRELLKRGCARLVILKEGLPEIRKASGFQNFYITEAETSFKNIVPEYKSKLELRELSNKLQKLHKLKVNSLGETPSPKNLLDDLGNFTALKKEADILKKLDLIAFPKIVINSKISEYKELTDTVKIVSLLKNIEELKLPDYSVTINLSRYEELKSLLKCLREYQSNIKSMEAELLKIKSKVNLLSNKLKEFKVCPLCHKPLEDA